ncbi:unnamed protein product, partial [marine sediment metagenome]
MACKLHEDIDAVLLDYTGNRFIAQAADVSVVVELSFKAFGHPVRESNIAISINFYVPAVVSIKQRLKEICYRMCTKIGRDVTNAKPTVRVGRIIVRHSGQSWRGMKP